MKPVWTEARYKLGTGTTGSLLLKLGYGESGKLESVSVKRDYHDDQYNLYLTPNEVLELSQTLAWVAASEQK